MSSGKDLGYAYSRLVRISGEDATPQSQDDADFAKTNFIVDFGYNLQQVKRVSVVSVTFPNTAYNFIDSPSTLANNTICYQIKRVAPPGVLANVTYTLSPGFWSVDQVIAQLNQWVLDFKAINANTSHTPTCVFTESKTGGPVSVTTGVIDANYEFVIYDCLPNMNSSPRGPLHQLGFDVFLDVVAPTTLTAKYLPSLQGLTECYIASNTLAPGYCVDEKNQNSAILLAIPITVPYGSLNVFECKQDILCEISYPTSRNIQRCDFTLVDRFFNKINLHGANLKLTLKVFFNNY